MSSNRLPLEERLGYLPGRKEAPYGNPVEAVTELAHMPLPRYFCGFYDSLYGLERLLGLSEDETSGMCYQDMALAVCRAGQAGALAPDRVQKAVELLAAPLVFRGGPRSGPECRLPLAERLEQADRRLMPIPCAQVPVNDFFSVLTDLTSNSVWEYTYNYEFFDLAPEEETPTLAGFLVRVARRHPAEKRDTYLRTLAEPFAALVTRERKGNET